MAGGGIAIRAGAPPAGQDERSAETACERPHKAFPRKRQGSAGGDDDGGRHDALTYGCHAWIIARNCEAGPTARSLLDDWALGRLKLFAKFATEPIAGTLFGSVAERLPDQTSSRPSTGGCGAAERATY